MRPPPPHSPDTLIALFIIIRISHLVSYLLILGIYAHAPFLSLFVLSFDTPITIPLWLSNLYLFLGGSSLSAI
jgi:hypothetical protein